MFRDITIQVQKNNNKKPKNNDGVHSLKIAAPVLWNSLPPAPKTSSPHLSGCDV